MKKFKKRKKRTKRVLNLTIQLVIVILYTKYECSILYGCEDICDEKCEKKEKETNTEKS